MAEIIVTAFVTVLFEKLASADFMKIARSEGIDIQLIKWKKTFSDIQLVLADAGQKQTTQKSVESWLHDLQDLAYDIDDVVDDLATEAMRRKLNRESHATTSRATNKVLKFIPTCCTNSTPRKIMYGHKMSSKLDEISTKLHSLFEQKSTLGLNANAYVERSSNRTNRRMDETSLVDESKVMGREGDKEALLEKLLGNESSNQKVNIVCIVGLGGIGKTTIAQVLYNEEKVKDHFELRAWVCVSEEYDVFSITKAIFQAVTKTNQDFANLDLLQVALKEKLTRKRFLVVLDDVWNEEYKKWELLQRPFLEGAPGSKVIVTTRKTKVASVMNCFQPYDLNVFSEEKAMSLFARYALDEENFDNHPTLKFHGEGIVKKCGRLPLALITLGRVLRTKTNIDDWEELLNSEIWNLGDESEILPALRLSYYDLPSHLKQLFAYCSLFPKDHVFDKNKLVLMWMGEGFLNQGNGRKWKESLGREYFEELKSRSFFQMSTDYDQSRYIMHDLLIDLATSVAGQFFFRLDDKIDAYDVNESFEKFRHVSFIGKEYVTCRKFKELQRARGLRTFLPVSINLRSDSQLLNNALAKLLPQLQFVRVLSLSDQSITEIPESIGSLKHIRYLSFSETPIVRLPEQVSDLYNLQTLLLFGCQDLSSLPVSFVKLINLRHLDISDTPRLNKTPLGIGGLTSLQTLPKVIIERGKGFKISELKCLSDLEGRLSIRGLEKVINPIEANDAKLHQKKGLDDMVMEWNEVFDESRNHMIEYEVLKGLRPHHKLRKLEILFYGGMEFPSWVGDPSFDQLMELTLSGCRSCTHLPTFGHLQSLKNLFVGSMNGVKTLDYFSGIAFPSLEVLKFFDMQGWERWSSSGGDNARLFPRLRYISITNCPKLVEIYIDSIPSLQFLRIKGCREEMFKSIVGASSSIRLLVMEDIIGLAQLNGEVLELLGAVKYLSISRCHELRYLFESNSEACKFLVSLRELQIMGCMKLVSMGEKRDTHEHLESLTSLRVLEIRDCPSMDYSFPCGLWPPNLRSLTIGCLNKPMSERGLQNYPTSLVALNLYGKNSGVVSFVANAKDHVTNTTFLLPPSITHLTIRDFMDVESVSEVLQHLPCLEELVIWSCPKLKDVPESSSSLDIKVFK